MLIDSNAYVGHWPFLKLEHNTPETLITRMREFGTDLSVISNLNGIFYKNTQHANEELWNLMRSKKIYQDRLIPFAVINPIYGGWRDDFKVCADKMKMQGVRLYPQYHGYDIAGDPCIELVKRSRDNGLPVAFCMRMVDSRTSSWLDIDKEWTLKNIVPIINAVPDAKYMIVNAANSLALNKEEMELCKKANLLIDSSGRNISNWGDLFGLFGAEKFCFGTHAPILDYFTGLLRIEALRENEASEKTKELLRSGNLKRMLDL